MITINGMSAGESGFAGDYGGSGIEKQILDEMAASDAAYDFSSAGELRFQLRLRRAIIDAAVKLSESGLNFRTFRNTFCNTDYWTRKNDGGFELKRGVKPGAAISDIYSNGEKYGTECATAMQIIYYKALLDVIGEKAFDKTFGSIYLMNWHSLDPKLSKTGLLPNETDFFPGDRRYFRNPEVNAKTPEWQGENVIDMGDGTYYGHGLGRHNAEYIIDALNKNRRSGAETSAYLMPAAGRPDFKKLYELYGENGGL